MIFLLWQDKALAEMDKEESAAESNESDSEETAFHQEMALAEKEQVNHLWEVLQEENTRKENIKAEFIVRVTSFSKMGNTTTPSNATPEEWMQILTTPSFPQTEPPPSSDSRSKHQRLKLLIGCTDQCLDEMCWLL